MKRFPVFALIGREDVRLMLGVLDHEGDEARTRKRLRRRKYKTKVSNDLVFRRPFQA